MEIVVAGGGAAGFFGAITAARRLREEGAPGRVTLLEKGSAFLTKVRISGGGRCNVTHACFDPRLLATHYPRGERALIGPFRRFSPADTVRWYEARGVPLKTEEDGRMFPVTDSSQTIIDCLLEEARREGVTLRTRCGIASVEREADGFRLRLSDGTAMRADRLLLATGGHRTAGGGGGEIAAALGHTLEPPVPSLFTFHIETPWLRSLAGVSLDPAEVSIPGTGLRERGPLLMTHWGVSGPVVLRLSAWGARLLYERDYRFALRVNWAPHLHREAIEAELRARRETHPRALVTTQPLRPIPARIWEQLVLAAGIAPSTRWTVLPRQERHRLVETIAASSFAVTGKSTHKAEFVTCGGVRLGEVDFRTMESRIVPGLFFAGELLDVDGITGGFNFQAAWTTGWIAGNAMA